MSNKLLSDLIKVISLIIVSLFSILVFPGAVSAISKQDFNPGRIIDDSVFFNKASMSVNQIQTFLNSKVPFCDTNHSGFIGGSGTEYNPPWVCLKDFYENSDAPYTISYRYKDTTGNDQTGTKTFYRNNAYEFKDLTAVYVDGDYTKGIKHLSATVKNLGGAVPKGARSAAEIIYDAAQTYSINPQVILVTLQKEQGLITDTWPAPWQYQAAMGYGCPDTAPCNDGYAGFSKQVYSAAYQFRYYTDHPNSFNFKAGVSRYIAYSPSASCGGANILLQNRATANLYNYTPYQPNVASLENMSDFSAGGSVSCGAYGNRNFFWYFTKWFGSTTSGAKPSPVYQSESTGKYYVVWENTKYLVLSYDLLIAWGLHNYPVSTSSDSYLNQMSDGGSLSNIVKISGDPNSKLFLLDDGKRYEITYEACAKDLNGVSKNTSWGIDCFNSNVTKTYPQFLISNYTVEDIKLPQMIAFGPSVWKLEQGKKRRVIDPLIVDVLGGWSKVRWMKDYNAQQPEGKLVMRNGFTVKFSNSDAIYRFDNESLHSVVDFEKFYAWGLQSQPVSIIPQEYNQSDPLPIGDSLYLIAYNKSKDTYYLISDGFKIPLGTSSISDWPTEKSIQMDWTLDQLKEKPLGAIFNVSGGDIFTVLGKKKYVYPTMNDFLGLGAKIDQIQKLPVSASSLQGLGYGGMHLQNGRLYKIRDGSNPNQIYMVKDSKSLLINSTQYPGLPYSDLIMVDTITANRYPVSGTYKP